ncbi:LytTR family transcriptional regulator [Mesorhizobium sp. PAMC28654]|uniref:LytTR family DNA-binding domain-containing protein n=1 Tax=Mesorhizobium sp. PAMC28654 TaxID=2880934 RepID=UPI001D0BD675|nr:LytTR family DNA-binding domain-containing protein [Mesorhizobium sp. PAMC28654]UDL87153.1 LytTR family transcriptional regulator [Mesorhizobium sp. PAMC28654]
MKDTLLHSTLREMQALLFSPRFWGALAAVSAILGLTGPFGTYQQLELLPRFAYWLALALVTFIAGHLAMRLTLGIVFGNAGAQPVRTVVAGIAAGVPVTLVVLLFNHALFGGPVPPVAEVARLFVNCSLIAAAISFLSTLAGRGARNVPASDGAPADELAGNDAKQDALDQFPPSVSPPSQSARSALNDRLPHAIRGKLAYLSMQDHYVEVHTDKGTTLVLMRLADAIREAGDIPGLQIHRSHWVALDAVTGNRRKDGKLFLKLGESVLLPVSRSYADAVRKAGLI